MSSLSRAIKIIVILWAMAAVTALPYALTARTYYHVVHPITHQIIPDSLICNIGPDYVNAMKYMFQITAFLLFMIPMTVITVLYILIGLTLRRSSHIARRSLNTSRGDSSPTASRRAVLKMLGKSLRLHNTLLISLLMQGKGNVASDLVKGQRVFYKATSLRRDSSVKAHWRMVPV